MANGIMQLFCSHCGAGLQRVRESVLWRASSRAQSPAKWGSRHQLQLQPSQHSSSHTSCCQGSPQVTGRSPRAPPHYLRSTWCRKSYPPIAETRGGTTCCIYPCIYAQHPSHSLQPSQNHPSWPPFCSETKYRQKTTEPVQHHPCDGQSILQLDHPFAGPNGV